jgi:Mg-chelatase subunit ChlI
MATKLTKKLVRECEDQINGQEIIITLTPEQEIELKVKGQRGKGKTIYIKDLFTQLYDIDTSSDKKSKNGPLSISTNKTRKRGDNKMISLYDLRSHNAISTLDVPTMAKFDQIIKSVIDNM